MGKNGKNEVIRGEYPKGPPRGIADPEHWEGDFEDMPFWTKIEKIYEIPTISDMAGVIIRAGITDERRENAIIRLAGRHLKFHDNPHQEMLRMKCAAIAGRKGVARLEALFASTNLVAPDMYRIVKGMPRRRDGSEPVHRGSDFRERVDVRQSQERDE